jgi:hypothetical protein
MYGYSNIVCSLVKIQIIYACLSAIRNEYAQSQKK